MHYCQNPLCGQLLRGPYAHCHHGCGWVNPYYREMAYEEELREEIREEIFMEEIVEDFFDGDIF